MQKDSAQAKISFKYRFVKSRRGSTFLTHPVLGHERTTLTLSGNLKRTIRPTANTLHVYITRLNACVTGLHLISIGSSLVW